MRDILPQGQLKERHIWDVMPFDNRLVVGKFKGRDLPAVVLGDSKVEPDRTYTLMAGTTTNPAAAVPFTGGTITDNGSERTILIPGPAAPRKFYHIIITK